MLHDLRRALPDADRFIEVTPRTLRRHPAALVWVDVTAFEQAVAEGRLDEAVQTYAGELLEGATTSGCSRSENAWASSIATHLSALAREFEGEGRLDEAIRCAERILRHDPLRGRPTGS